MRRTRVVIAGMVLALLATACDPTQPVPTTAPASGTAVEPTLGASIAAEASPIPTTSPPAVTAYSDPVVSSAAGRLALSTTLSTDGVALAGAPITVTTTALGKTYQTLMLKGVVPLPARSVIIQLGFNNQPDTGPADYDIRIDRITYADGGKSKNRLPNGSFDSGIFRWAVYGEGTVTTPKSDFGDGRLLRLRAAPDEEIVINSYGIGVTPGSTYTMKVTAEVPPAGNVSGYVAAIFLKEIEIWRESIYVVAGPIPIADVQTGADGSIVLDDALPAGRYLVRISYAGDATHAPTLLEQEVTVK